MSLFKVLRGDSDRISTDVTPFHDGYAYFTPDDGGFYIDATHNGEDRRIRINSTGKTEIMSETEPASLAAGDDWDKVLQ